MMSKTATDLTSFKARCWSDNDANGGPGLKPGWPYTQSMTDDQASRRLLLGCQFDGFNR